MTLARCLLVVCLMSLTAGCGDDTPIQPTPIDPTVFTEVFTGTINQNGAASHPFVTQSSGAVVVTLTSVAPDAAQVIGVSLGTWTGAACQTSSPTTGPRSRRNSPARSDSPACCARASMTSA